ncbi:MAG: hypothetical protein QOD63_709, partial [Actinomycetota bacterium]|nr:hypothetical protein [Actinomycetota bacterium]
IAGALLWWIEGSGRIDEWWQGTAASLLVLAFCLAPAAWLLYVRVALLELVELPDKLAGMAARRIGQLGAGQRGAGQLGAGQPAGLGHLPADAEPERPKGGVVGGARSVRGIVSDYGDVVGSWGAVAQLLVPSFWFFSAAALAAVPILVVLVAVAGLAELTIR